MFKPYTHKGRGPRWNMKHELKESLGEQSRETMGIPKKLRKTMRRVF